jgi:gluconate 2-dehydrogenase gamma chain
MSDRRRFILTSMGGATAAWLTTNWPAQVAAAEKAQSAGGFAFFAPAQAAEIDALSAQIYPTDHLPGAREAGVTHFIDLALVTFARDKQGIYTKGFEELAAKTGGKPLGSLPDDQQIALLTSIEKTPFFRTVRDHTIMGLFSAPQHGGNFRKVGWQQIGFDDSLNFRAPFGAYDKA